MNSINKQTKNLGGISKFFLVPVDQYVSLSDPDANQIRTLTITSMDTAWEISAIYQSIQYSEKLQLSKSGYYYDKSFTARIAKDSAQTYADLRSLVNRTWILIYQDQNGQWKLVSNPAYPLRFEFSTTTGSNVADLNHFEIKLKGKGADPSAFIFNPIS